MAIRRGRFVAFLFTRGTARLTRGVSLAWPGFLFSLNPRGLTVGAQVGDRFRWTGITWWRAA